MADDVGRRHHPAVADRVGHVEQAADERPVAGDDLVGQLLAVRRRLLDDEPTLRPDRDDQRVLDHLRLHQAEDLGPEVLAAVRPAQAAAGHGAAAQVHALDACGADEDLEARARSGKQRNARRIELEREIRLGRAASVRLEVVRSQHRAHDGEEAAQDPVLVEALDRVDRLLDLVRDRVRGRRGVLALGGEARAEELHQRGRHARMGEQRLLHIALAERHARLPQVARDGPQHGDVAPVEPRAQHQAVEAVALDLAPPDARERILEALSHLAHVELAAGRVVDAEVVDPGRRPVARRDLVGPLVARPQPHALEHRQDRRERQRLAAAVELAAQRARGGLERAVEADRELLVRREPLDSPDVHDRRARKPVLAVADRKRIAVAAVQRGAVLLSELVEQCFAQVVGPRAGRLHDPRLDRGRVVGGQPARPHPHREVDAHEHRLRQAQLEVDALGVERLGQDLLDALPVARVEAVAREEHEAGDVALEGVAADEHPHALALPEREDAHGELEQLVRGNLEELVARVGVEDLQQRLLRVAGGRERGARDDRLDLAPDDRDLACDRAVRGCRVEPEEAALAHDLARGPEALDADVVQVAGTVHGRTAVGLREDQRTLLARERATARRQRGPAGALGGGRVAEDPEPGPRDRTQAILAVARQQVVLAEAEEREVAIVHPCQQRGGLEALVAIQRRRRIAQLGDQLRGALAHRRPVLDGRRHLAQDGKQPLAQPLQIPRLAVAIDLEVDERLQQGALVRRGIRREDGRKLTVGLPPDAHDGMDELVDPGAAAAERHRRRVDQERHLVGDDLDDRVQGLPAVLLELRVVHAHQRRPGLAPAGEAAVRERGAVEVERVQLDEVLERHAPVVLADELLGLRRLVLPQPLPDARADRLDQRAVDLLDPRRGHGPSLLSQLPTGAASAASSGTSRSTKPSGAGPGSAPGSRSYRYGAR